MFAKWILAAVGAGCLACSCSEKPERWDFDNLDGLVCTHQDDNPARQIECRNGVMKIFTRANSRDRKKVRTVGSDYGAGRYTWRVYIPEMGVGDQASVGAFIYHDDQHELDFEIGYGPQEVRERIGAKPGEMVAYMTTQDNPHQSVQVPIACGWHTCDIELSLRDGMFHLCYTRPRAEFVRFFGQLRALFSEEEVRTALVWGSEKIDWFADVLLRGDVRACKRGIVRALNAPLGI